MKDITTTAALADLLGVTQRAITHMAKRGVIERKAAGFVLGDSVRRYCDHLR